MNKFLRRLLDDYPGLVLVSVILLVIGGFIIFTHPFTHSSPNAQSKPTPTPSVATTVKGTAIFKCTHNCPTDFSAYDIVAYTSTSSSTPIAQAPMTNKGAFTLYLPTGTYYITTLPATSSPAIKILVTTRTPPISLTISP